MQALDDVAPGAVRRRLVSLQALGVDHRPRAQADFRLELPDECRLADPFLTGNADQPGVASTGPLELRHQGAQLVFAGHEGLEVHLRPGRCRVGVIGYRHPGAPIALGLVQGAVTGRQEQLNGLAVLCGAGHCDGNGDGDFLFRRIATGRAQAGRRIAKAFGDLQCNLGRGIGKEDEKLIASPAPDQVAGTQPTLQHLGHRPEDIIALQAPVRRIQSRKVVDVEGEQGDGTFRSAAVGEHAHRPLEPRRAIGHRREGIVQQRRFARFHSARDRGSRGDTGNGDAVAQHLFEYLEHRRVEVSPHISTHDLQRVVRRKGVLERASRHEGVEYVGDGKDARRQRNLDACQTVRIPRSVPAFVMRFDHRSHLPREIDRAQHLGAGHGVPFDDGPFVTR